MAQLTTNYGLYKPEATDTYNHLVYDNPNMDTIDGAMKNNADHGVDNASCIKSGTVHSITRTNTSCPVFKFTATGDWNTGDTMNVDGTPVSVFLPNGTAPLTGCFVINTEVLAAISGSRVTLMCPVIPDASDVVYDNSGSSLTATDVQNALDELSTSTDASFKSLDSWTAISSFNINDDTFTATNDGFILVRATGVAAVNGTYCYLYDTNFSASVPVATIALPAGGSGLTYAMNIPATKGHTFKLLMGGAITTVNAYFMKINK